MFKVLNLIRIFIEYNNYDPYPSNLSDEIHRIKEKIQKLTDLIKLSEQEYTNRKDVILIIPLLPPTQFEIKI